MLIQAGTKKLTRNGRCQQPIVAIYPFLHTTSTARQALITFQLLIRASHTSGKSSQSLHPVNDVCRSVCKNILRPFLHHVLVLCATNEFLTFDSLLNASITSIPKPSTSLPRHTPTIFHAFFTRLAQDLAITFEIQQVASSTTRTQYQAAAVKFTESTIAATSSKN